MASLATNGGDRCLSRARAASAALSGAPNSDSARFETLPPTRRFGIRRSNPSLRKFMAGKGTSDPVGNCWPNRVPAALRTNDTRLQVRSDVFHGNLVLRLFSILQPPTMHRPIHLAQVVDAGVACWCRSRADDIRDHVHGGNQRQDYSRTCHQDFVCSAHVIESTPRERIGCGD